MPKKVKLGKADVVIMTPHPGRGGVGSGTGSAMYAATGGGGSKKKKETPHPFKPDTPHPFKPDTPHPYKAEIGAGSLLFKSKGGKLTVEAKDVKDFKFQLSIDKNGDMILKIDDE
ncbi:hypothetical protein F183_A11670 [Bryobacterales bacterium F-183]|nr:hypothetical protein F183_A11670 [Bryobacterales bacterium F-183]